jgi:hypothetical protein
MNEDFVALAKADSAQYTVNLEIMEVPVFCDQSINMLSNNVDFMTAEPIDHGVESMVVKPGTTKSDSQKFHSWWNYHRNAQHKTKERKSLTIDASDNSQGVMVVLEAEDTSLSMDSLMDFNDTITESLKKAGLTVLSSSLFETEVIFIALKEGYVMSRNWPKYNYCAFDLFLWSGLDKLDTAKAGLAAAVVAKSTSSFNIVTSGMRGIESVEVPKFPDETNADSSICTDLDAPSATSFELSDLDAITEEMIALVQSAESVTVVLCPDKEVSCQSLELLKNSDSNKIGKYVSVFDASESATLEVMKLALSHGQIDGIIIDPEAPREMGQVIKQILHTSSTRKQLLARQYVVLAPTLDSSGSWRNSLLEWFRTQVVMQTPDHHAEVIFGSDNKHSGNLKVGIFSAGDVDFYPHLVDIIEKCESRTGLVAKVPSVQDGMHKFKPTLDPLIVANESSYDKKSANSQWESQNPLGMQTIFQFEAKIPDASISVGDKVMGNYQPHPSGITGTWQAATVVSKNDDDTYDLYYVDGDDQYGMEGHLIEKWNIAADVSASDAVLVRNSQGEWEAGRVMVKLPDNRFKVHIYDWKGSISIVNEPHIMKRFEKPDKLPPSPKISCSMLKKMLDKAVAVTVTSSARMSKEKEEIHYGAGDGCVATALWSKGNAVATWDGGHHIVLNLFTFEENKKMHQKFANDFSKITTNTKYSKRKYSQTLSFTMVSHHEQPRGFGRVINFKHEMKTIF